MKEEPKRWKDVFHYGFGYTACPYCGDETGWYNPASQRPQSDLKNNQREHCPKCGRRVYAREGWIMNQPELSYLKKDRFTSALGHVYPLYYDPSSRRFYDTIDTLRKNYSWDTQQHTEQLPFLTQEQIRMINAEANDDDPF